MGHHLYLRKSKRGWGPLMANAEAGGIRRKREEGGGGGGWVVKTNIKGCRNIWGNANNRNGKTSGPYAGSPNLRGQSHTNLSKRGKTEIWYVAPVGPGDGGWGVGGGGGGGGGGCGWRGNIGNESRWGNVGVKGYALPLKCGGQTDVTSEKKKGPRGG